MSELKPCPFCGSEAHIQIEHSSMFVHCMGVTCVCAVGENYDPDGMPDHAFYDEEVAIAAWNTRAAETALAAANATIERLSAPVSAPLVSVSFAIRSLSQAIHSQNMKWWATQDGKPLQRNIYELLCLIHSEISEGMEGHRKSLMDDKLQHRTMLEVELADALIRIVDMAAGLNLDLAGATEEKMAYNAKREDHKAEAILIAARAQEPK